MAISTSTAILGGAGIQAGTSLLGSYISGQQSKKAARRQYKYQKRILQNQLSWRVNDAKRAGIHPLYALGLSPASYSAPVNTGSNIGEGIIEAGQAIGGAVSRLPSRGERKETDLRLKLLESQIGETDARTLALQSEAARNLQNARSQVSGAASQLGVMDEDSRAVQSPLPVDPQFIYEFDIGFQDGRGNSGLHVDQPGAGIIQRTAPEVQTHKKGNQGIVSGTHPGYKEFRLPTGLPILLPEGQTLSEVLEETPFWMYKSLYETNKHYYGQDWADEFWEWLWHGRSGMSGKFSQ